MIRLLCCSLLLLAVGCAAFPDVTHKPTIHNPFPQLHRIAVIPFFNQSKEPTVDGDTMAIAYANELQQIPGFEVMPVGVAKQFIQMSGFEPRNSLDFQRLAKALKVDALVVGSVTEYYPYYPPRLGLTVDWYAANEGFHPIPIGYGLPWGTAAEEDIPESLKLAAEFELAREQLKTQTPTGMNNSENISTSHLQTAQMTETTEPELLPVPLPVPGSISSNAVPAKTAVTTSPAMAHDLPGDWPDPRGFVPPSPSATRPIMRPQSKPVMTHTRLYNGKDAEFTEKLAHYFYTQDDARFGGWQGYLHRPEDFARFCCHLHLTEMLAARGGAGRTQVMVRWPISR